MNTIVRRFQENPWAYLLSSVFVVAAIFTRFYMLGNKPVHFDESINMWFTERIWEEGFFKYDPTNFHGPLHFYVVHFLELFTGYHFIATRVAASLFSVLTLIALWWGPKEDRTAFRWASLFLLISPAMNFFGRSGIHESSFVCFQVIGFLGFHYFVANDYKKFWWYFIAGLLGVMALKETFVILILAWIPSVAIMWFIHRKKFPLKKTLQACFQKIQEHEVYMPLLAMLFIFVGIFTGFGVHPKGIVDFFIALMPWLKTGVHGAGHEKSFWHWSILMGKNEFAVVAGFFAGLPWLLKNQWIIFYGVLSLFLWLIYSLIPYKTPWCLISIIWPFAIVAGYGMQELFKRASSMVKISSVAVVAALSIGSLYKTSLIQFKNPIDMGHEYVYVNSTYELKNFLDKVDAAVRKNPMLLNDWVQISLDESWPFPVVFKSFFNLSYEKVTNRIFENALIYMVEVNQEDALKAKIGDNYERQEFAVRQGRNSMVVYMRRL